MWRPKFHECKETIHVTFKEDHGPYVTKVVQRMNTMLYHGQCHEISVFFLSDARSENILQNEIASTKSELPELLSRGPHFGAAPSLH